MKDKNKLHPQLRAMLANLRARRGFDARAYVDAKVRLLNDYCARSGLTAVVWGNSGGVDSAVVTALVAEAMKQPGSPIKRAVAVLLPYFIKEGTTNQSEATTRGREVSEHFGAECHLVDLSGSHVAMQAALDSSLGTKSDAWAAGQLVTYLRTPALFQTATLVRMQGYPSMVLGTCNRDEGSYIGYFGKAGDYMADMHLISDAHKSEVYAVARLLGVPASVLDAAPTGDIYDGRTDRQLIGAPYDFLELYELYLCVDDQVKAQLLGEVDNPDARREFGYFGEVMQTLNRQNAHKYLGGCPAVHLDVLERAVPGGWRPEHESAPEPKVNVRKLIKPFSMNKRLVSSLRAGEASTRRAALEGFGDTASLVHGVLSRDEVAALVSELDRRAWAPANQNGKAATFDATTEKVGSYRATTCNEDFAAALWQRLVPNLPVLRFADKSGPTTDWGNYPVWRAVGVSPVMRFIKYTEGGLLVPHYDAPFDYHDGKRTLMSLVLYLTDNTRAEGGATRFIRDPQFGMPLDERNLDDWTRYAKPEDVLLRVKPRAGSALVFDHRLLHDSEPLLGGVKIIMRTDIIFERCGLPRRAKVTVSRPLGMPEQSATA
jgi:NAD+ synthetase